MICHTTVEVVGEHVCLVASTEDGPTSLLAVDHARYLSGAALLRSSFAVIAWCDVFAQHVPENTTPMSTAELIATAVIQPQHCAEFQQSSSPQNLAPALAQSRLLGRRKAARRRDGPRKLRTPRRVPP